MSGAQTGGDDATASGIGFSPSTGYSDHRCLF